MPPGMLRLAPGGSCVYGEDNLNNFLPCRNAMKKYLRYLGPVLITALFVLAIYLLYHKLKAYSIAQIRESIQQVSTGSICFSIGLMIVNYIILVGYDWLALKAIHKSLPLPRGARLPGRAGRQLQLRGTAGRYERPLPVLFCLGLFPGRDRPSRAHAGRHLLGRCPGTVRRGLPAGAARDP